ncbi:MAG: type II secretion system protein GspN [Deltaproteobacteria bacterium]|nr:type II secretion system protein GspN [Deltaproteobacteria bacterium]
MKMTFNKKILGYVVFGIAVVIAFLYLRFPGKVIGDYIIAAVSANNPDAVLTIGAVKPYFPPGVKFLNIAYGSKQNPGATLRVDDLTARLSLISLLKGKTALLLNGNVYGGTLKGRCEYAKFLSLSKLIKYEIRVSDVGLDRFAYAKGTFNRNITGKLNGSFVYHRSYDRVGEGSGTAEFTIVNGSYQLLSNLLGFDSIDFSRIEGRLSMKGDALKVEKIGLSGAKFNCSLKGEVALDKNIDSSSLTITGAVEVAGMGGRKIGVAVGGILKNPTVRLIP